MHAQAGSVVCIFAGKIPQADSAIYSKLLVHHVWYLNINFAPSYILLRPGN
jgi:hypothetical protein